MQWSTTTFPPISALQAWKPSVLQASSLAGSSTALLGMKRLLHRCDAMLFLAGLVEQANEVLVLSCHRNEQQMWQGLLAGVNAARRAQSLPLVELPRNSSYIGTLLDDLVTKVPALASPLHNDHPDSGS